MSEVVGALPGSGHFQFFPVLGRKPDIDVPVFRLCHLFLRKLHPFLYESLVLRFRQIGHGHTCVGHGVDAARAKGYPLIGIDNERVLVRIIELTVEQKECPCRQQRAGIVRIDVIILPVVIVVVD